MSEKFYIGDWHYAHANCLHFDNRPFATVDQMNEALVKRWNDKVSNGDLVYVIGDMFWCNPKNAIPVLEALNGQKFLIKGNHDRCKDQQFAKEFIKISNYEEIKDGDKNIVLCHYPSPCFKNHFYGWYHFYAHVHTSFEYNMIAHMKRMMSELYDKPCNMFNVGAMMPYMDYTPRTSDEIIAGGSLFEYAKFAHENEE